MYKSKYKFSLHYVLEQLVLGWVRLWDLRSNLNTGNKWPETQRADIIHVSLLTLLAHRWHCTMNAYIWETSKLPKANPYVPAPLQASPVTAVRAGAGGFLTEDYPICTANVEKADSCLMPDHCSVGTWENRASETSSHSSAYVIVNKHENVGDAPHSQQYKVQLQLIRRLEMVPCFFERVCPNKS